MLSVALLLAIVGVAASTLFGDHGVAHLLRLRAERRELGRIAFTLIQRNEELRDDVRKLRTDDHQLEVLARRQLGLVRPNELVYRLRRD
jgi:cell division protein FtsB